MPSIIALLNRPQLLRALAARRHARGKTQRRRALARSIQRCARGRRRGTRFAYAVVAEAARDATSHPLRTVV